MLRSNAWPVLALVLIFIQESRYFNSLLLAISPTLCRLCRSALKILNTIGSVPGAVEARGHSRFGAANRGADLRADTEPSLQRGSRRVRGAKTTTIRRRHTLNEADANSGSRSAVFQGLTLKLIVQDF